MSQLGLDGTARVDPVTFIVTIGGFIPSGFVILHGVSMLVGFAMVGNAVMRQMATARGRAETTGAQNLMHAFFGAALAVLAELIGSFGKGVFGDFQSASVLLYVSKDDTSLARVAMGAFLYLCQFIGSIACFHAIRIADRLATYKPQPGETWMSVFWFAFGGLALVFIQITVGLFSAVTGMQLARFINNL